MRGPYRDLVDFVTRVDHKDLNKKSLESLAKSGALDSLGIERNQVLANMDEILKFNQGIRKAVPQNHNSLFGEMPKPNIALRLKEAPPATPQERLIWEKELIGFYLSDHPLNSFVEKIKALRAKNIEEALKIQDETKPFITAGLISKIRKILTKNNQEMIFATVEDLSAKTMEVVVFNSALKKTYDVWKENSPVLIQGHMSLRNGEVKMICEKAQTLK